MARPHHRKKHKTQVRQYKKTHDSNLASPQSKARAVSVFTISGAVAGFAIGYFASQGSVLWLIVGLLTGGAIGYFIGRKMDEAP